MTDKNFAPARACGGRYARFCQASWESVRYRQLKHCPGRAQSVRRPKAPWDRRPGWYLDSDTAGAPTRPPNPDCAGGLGPAKDTGGTSVAQGPATGRTDSDCQPLQTSVQLGLPNTGRGHRDLNRLGPMAPCHRRPLRLNLGLGSTQSGGRRPSRGSPTWTGRPSELRTARRGRPAQDGSRNLKQT